MIFLVVEKGWEYNDQYYEEHGFEAAKKLFDNKKEAEKHAAALNVEKIRSASNYNYKTKKGEQGCQFFNASDYIWERHFNDEDKEALLEIGVEPPPDDYHYCPFRERSSDEVIIKGLSILRIAFYDVIEIEEV